MTTEYQQDILNLSGAIFENIEDSDQLTWKYEYQGKEDFDCWYYLYTAEGNFKSMSAGKPLDLALRVKVKTNHTFIPEQTSIEIVEEQPKKKRGRPPKVKIC